MNLPLTESQIAQIVADARQDIVTHVIASHKDDLDTISTAQAGGILDISAATLSNIPRKQLPRYVIIPNKVVKYRLSEVRAYLATTREG